MRDEINEEQRARTEATDGLYNKLTETVKSLQAKIKDEREDRETTEDGLLQLLEQTCKKVEDMAGQ